MKRIEFDGNKISVPTHWGEVKLDDYEKWYANKPQNSADYVQYIADICGADSQKLMEAPAEILSILRDMLSFVSSADLKPSSKLTIGNTDYYISLSDKLTLGEWVDIDAALNAESSTRLSDLLAIVCRPLGETYNHEQAAERAHLFRQQPCDQILPLVGFFLRKDNELKETLHHSSTVVEAANQFLRDIKTFVASGDGTKQLPIWQRIRFYFLTRSLEKQLSRFSDLCSIG